jgi:hypothetical protein
MAQALGITIAVVVVLLATGMVVGLVGLIVLQRRGHPELERPWRGALTPRRDDEQLL